MLIMALDHVRMYFGPGSFFSNPADLSTTTPLLFFTRWITHFCAPAFVFLSGTAAYLYGIRSGQKGLTRFLLTRAVWLIFVEIAIVTFGWTFDITYGTIILQVIWAIAISMLCLAALLHLRMWMITALGLALVLGHNVLDRFTAEGSSLGNLLWYALHQKRFVALTPDLTLGFEYPVLPWIGLMCLGYVAGLLFQADFDAVKRRRWLIRLGVGTIILFLILRSADVYFRGLDTGGSDTVLYKIMAFLNAQKYPPSVMFSLMTMGPALIFLSYAEKMKGWLAGVFVMFGRVPFLYYILHISLIHSLAMISLAIIGRNPTDYILNREAFKSEALADSGFSLRVVYGVWILTMVLMHPICKWYSDYKSKNRDKWWLSYL